MTGKVGLFGVYDDVLLVNLVDFVFHGWLYELVLTRGIKF